jgi:hypothetical protein
MVMKRVIAITPRVAIHPQIEFSAAYRVCDLEVYECDIEMLPSSASMA